MKAVTRAVSTSVMATFALDQPKHTRRNLIFLCLLALALLLPFVTKPLHLDDPVYVWVAQQIRSHPFDFYSFHLNWQGHDQPVSRFLESPPMLSYFLAAVSLVTGFQPFAFHISFLAVNLLSVIGMFLLAEKFCGRPFLAALLFLICPAFLVSATTLMCEPLMICLWIWAMYLWIVGTERAPWLLFVAGMLALIAILTKYIAISIVPLLILYSILRPARARIRWMHAIALSIPVAGAIGYEMLTAHRYGTGAFAGATDYLSASHRLVVVPAAVKLLNTFCFTGGCAAACVAMLPLIFRRWITILVLLSIAGLSVAAAVCFLPPDGWIQNSDPKNSDASNLSASLAFYAQSMFWMVAGLSLCALFIIRLIRQRRQFFSNGEAFLFAWMAGIFVFAGFINWCINARVILPMLPPVCILTVRALDSIQVLPRLRTRFALGLAAVLAITVARADYNLASTIRTGADESAGVARAAQNAAGVEKSPLWFVGHWGFQYYMEALGGRAVDDLAPKWHPGDIVIFPAESYGGTPGGSGFLHIRRLEIGPSRWVATTQVHLGAAFYCSYGYGLPFVFASIPPEAVDILRVTPGTKIHP